MARVGISRCRLVTLFHPHQQLAEAAPCNIPADACLIPRFEQDRYPESVVAPDSDDHPYLGKSLGLKIIDWLAIVSKPGAIRISEFTGTG